MKKLLFFFAAVTLGTAVNAQHNHQQNTAQQQAQIDHTKDHVMMMDGKMMLIKNGTSTVMDKDLTLRNGTTIMKNGKVKMKNGKTMTLKNGDMLYMNGKMARMPKTSMQKSKSGGAMKGC